MTSIRFLGIAVAAAMMMTAAAAQGASKTSLKCRTTIAKQAANGKGGVIKRGLAALDACHRKRDKGKFAGDCNVVSVANVQAKFSAAVARACKAPDEPVRKNYLDSDPVADVTSAVETALSASGTAVQGAPALAGDKAKVKCHAAIGKGRSAVVQSVVAAGVRCQTGLDKTSADLGELAASCVATAGGAGAKANAKIGKACGGVTGPDVGSCDPLPGCVIDSAQDTASTLAKAIYGQRVVCGDGIVQRGEQCDDGNTLDGDSCTHDCKTAACGDLIVSAGEDCDDGNIDNTDACTRVCPSGGTDCPTTALVCRTARCGDGFIQAGVEACDDGNDTPNDGCTNCTIDPTACQPGVGVVATVEVSYDDISRSMHGVELNLGYPSVVAIPGSGQDTSVQDRLTDAVMIPPDDHGVAFILLGNDSDTNSDGTEDQLRVVYGALENVPKGPVVNVLFDCTTPNTFLQSSSFSCVVTGTSDPDGQPIPGDNTCTVSVHVPSP